MRQPMFEPQEFERDTVPGCLIAVFIVAVVAVTFLVTGCCLAGCGAQASSATRSSYAIAAGLCVAREQAIVDNPCGELDEAACRARDYADLAAERERCASELARIENADAPDAGPAAGTP